MVDTAVFTFVVALACSIIIALVITHFYARHKIKGLLYSAGGVLSSMLGFSLIAYQVRGFGLFAANYLVIIGLCLFAYATFLFFEQKFPWIEIIIFTLIFTSLLAFFSFVINDRETRQILMSSTIIYVSIRVVFVLLRTWKSRPLVYPYTYLAIFLILVVIQVVRLIFVFTGIKDHVIPGIPLTLNYMSLLGSATAIVVLGLSHVLVINFLTLRELNEERAMLRDLSNLDYLTRIPNRRLLSKYVENLISNEEPFAVIISDMDEFKTINDTYGHAIGDAVLVTYAKIVQEKKPDNVFVARFGGDEFVYIVNKYESQLNLKTNIDKLFRGLPSLVTVKGHSFPIKSSVGVAFYPDNGKDYDSLLKNADAALYHVKKNEKNKVLYFSDLKKD